MELCDGARYGRQTDDGLLPLHVALASPKFQNTAAVSTLRLPSDEV